MADDVPHGRGDVRRCDGPADANAGRGKRLGDAVDKDGVGGDFGNEQLDVFKQHNVDTNDLEVIPDGKTFRWFGKYEYDLNVAHTLDTHLNVFAGFQPKLSAGSKSSRLVFLGNIQPDLQRAVRAQVSNAELVALDTMNLWIDTTRESLQKTIEVVDLLIVNDAEARQLAEEPNLIKAARKILSWGPHTLIVKRGEFSDFKAT